MPLDNSLEQTELYGHVPLVTEFGATDDLPTLRRVSRLADDRLISWQHWAWFNEDVCCDRPNESIVRDPSQPPTGDNLGDDKLDQIVYPYPTAVAGTPTSYGFDHEADRFDLEFTTARADGGGTFPAGSITTVDVPPRQYPDGYRVIDIEGVEVVSEPGARTLEVATLEGVDGGSLAVVPPADGGTGGGPTDGDDSDDDGSDGLSGGDERHRRNDHGRGHRDDPGRGGRQRSDPGGDRRPRRRRAARARGAGRRRAGPTPRRLSRAEPRQVAVPGSRSAWPTGTCGPPPPGVAVPGSRSAPLSGTWRPPPPGRQVGGRIRRRWRRRRRASPRCSRPPARPRRPARP